MNQHTELSLDTGGAIDIGSAWIRQIRRTSERVPVELRADLAFPDRRREGRMETLRVRILDVSASGCRLLASREVPQGAFLTLRVSSSSSCGELVMLGQAVRSSQTTPESHYEIGIRLIQQDDEVRRFLASCIENALATRSGDRSHPRLESAA